MRTYKTPTPVNVDAYQAGHFKLVPPGMRDFQCSQGAFRKPLKFIGQQDHRLLAAGTRPYVENNLLVPLTMDDVEKATEFYSTYHATTTPPYYKPYPYPREMFERVVKQYGGISPIVVMAQLDGQAHYVGEPHVQVFSDEPGMGELAGWIESDMIPYQSTSSIVATRGRMRKDAWIDEFRKVYINKSREQIVQMIIHKFVDFGRRGGAATQITGIAHFINWLSSDTCDAAYVVQMMYNDGKPFGASSIMAAAHRTVTPWPSEDDSMKNAIDQFGDGLLAFVADSYNYTEGMKKLASYSKVIKTKGGFLIGRPDSGDVVQTVIDGLRIFEEGFGIDETATAEANGFKVLNISAVLQGDGVSDEVLFLVLFPAIIAAGYSPINVAIGMGEHNHRAVRSETEDGYKTCLVGTGNLVYPEYRIYEPGYAQVMKGSENAWKRSNPCPIALNFEGAASGNYENRVTPISVADLKAGKTGQHLKIVFDGRPQALCIAEGINDRTPSWETWTATQSRAWNSWNELLPVPPCDTFSPKIRKMQERYMLEVGASLSS